MPWPEAVSLEGSMVVLEPLTMAHAGDLAEAAAEGDLHRVWYTTVPAPDQVGAEISRRSRLREAGSMLPFAVIDRASRKAVGMTTYLNVDAANRRVEIGATWYRKSVQRTGLNTQCKLLLLSHAFEDLACIAVEFRTHFMNHQSRKAIERLGAKLDGILRSVQVMPNGTLRDTCVYSIIACEWPAVRANLEAMQDRYR
ncbi:MAG: GNAT family N-acetyltransferase [Hyphomicrobiaceae bacterium]